MVAATLKVLLVIITIVACIIATFEKPPTAIVIVGAIDRDRVIITIMSGEWMAIELRHHDLRALVILRHGSYMESVLHDFAIDFEIVEHSPLYIWCFRPLRFHE